ncbi:UNVERIFIED_CONTAM: hypothetical protein HDU68_011044 [Siphonaria sp. JEL0065]|nr:hypothetical protein HDU68_011044 [Siphonaria sp. JEL0065]
MKITSSLPFLWALVTIQRIHANGQVQRPENLVGRFLESVESLPRCPRLCIVSQSVAVSGLSDLTVQLITIDDILAACQERQSISSGYLTCASKCNDKEKKSVASWIPVFRHLCRDAETFDKIHITFDKSQQNSTTQWSKYYNSTMTNYDWVNLREGIKAIVQIKQYGPVFLRLAWHDSATGNIWTGTGGPHATMNLQDPEDPQNKGLQRAIDALEPLYEEYHAKISRADLWSYAGAVAVRVMGGPNTKWRPGRQDISDILNARLKSPDNDLPRATDSWPTIKKKFESMGLNVSEVAALLHGGHGVGRCHREYSGYHGPWTGQENTFSNFYGPLLNPTGPKTNESLPAIKSWQRNGINPVNGGMVMELPSDVEMVETGFLDFPHSPSAGVPGPGANQDFILFNSPGRGPRDVFFKYFASAFATLLEVTLDPKKLGGFVSTEISDSFGWEPLV